MDRVKSRQSKQRSAIYSLLEKDTSHPTASDIYKEVKTIIPHISLGTVYRNLHVLEEQGLIRRLIIHDGQEHYDANLNEHHHFVCMRCHKIIDIDYDDQSIIENFKEKNMCVHSVSLIVNGICDDCQKKEDLQ